MKEGAAKLAKLAHLQYNHLLEFEKQPNIVVEMPDLSSGDDEMETQQGGKRQIVVQVHVQTGNRAICLILGAIVTEQERSHFLFACTGNMST